MDDLISRKALIEALEPEYMRKARMVENGEYHLDTLAEGFTSAHNLIESAPAVEAEPVKHGRWIPLEYDGFADGNPVWDLWECSECQEEHSGDEETLTPYCPNCGAKMDGDNNDKS